MLPNEYGERGRIWWERTNMVGEDEYGGRDEILSC